MNALLRLVNIFSWPIWFKLLMVLLVAVVIPAAVAFNLVANSIREVGLDSIRAYVSENGDSHRQQISTALNQARLSLDNFANDNEYLAYINSLLLRDVRAMPPLVSESIEYQQVLGVFNRVLLDPDQTLYTDVRLLDRDGRLVARAALNNDRPPVFGEDQSEGIAFQAAQTAQMTDRRQVLTVSNLNSPTLEITNVIYWRDGTPIGYLIATLDNEKAIYNNLTFNDNNTAYSFLVTANGSLISPPDSRTQAEDSLDSPAVKNALGGQSGIDIYRVGSGDNVTEVVGYYTPITNANTTLALITETSTDAINSQILDRVGVPGFALTVGALVLVVVLVILSNQLITPPLARLQTAMQGIAAGNFDVPLPAANREDEIGEVTVAFADMRQRVRQLIDDLEARIAARARDIGATQEISRFAATQRDVETLMNQVVDLIVQRFPNIYHAQIFLLDQNHQYAVLRASTGEVGARLLARGHRLAVGSVSVIGRVTEQGQIVLARDTAASQLHKRNEFLPNTRAELAIPLRIGETVIGALDVQSEQRDTFNEDQVAVLQTMADQIAVAIENARLYQESLRRLEEIERSNRQATMRAWQDYMADQRAHILSSEAGTMTSLDISPLRQRALETGEVAVGEITERQTIPIAVPIMLRGEALGAVEWELPSEGFDENKKQLALELTNRLAISLENARLFQTSRRATVRERLVNDIASQLTSQTNIDEILKTAVREVGQALRAPQVTIRLNQADAANNANGSGTTHANGANGNGNHA
jgi:GAF domain-containing protein/HAMP domain-containing protein